MLRSYFTPSSRRLSSNPRRTRCRNLFVEPLESRVLLAGVDERDPFDEIYASDAGNGDWFGRSVAIADDMVVVGAYKDDNEQGNDSGSAYLFYPDPNTGFWVQRQKIVPDELEKNDRFGSSVAIESNGDGWYTVAVGAPRADGNSRDSGAVYVFDVWVDEEEGGDELTVGVGEWLTADDGGIRDNLAGSRQLSIDGDTIVAGADQAAYIFQRDEGEWGETWSWDGDANFGSSVDVSGDTVVVGAWEADAVYVYQYQGSQWQEVELDRPHNDGFGWNVAINDNADTIVTSNNQGVYVYHLQNGEWGSPQHLPSTLFDPDGVVNLGWSADIAANPLDGQEYIVAGTVLDEGSYVFRRSGPTTWEPFATLVDPDPVYHMGHDVTSNGIVALSSDVLDDKSGVDGGSVYVFPLMSEPVPGITITPQAGLQTSESGGEATFEVVLQTQPDDDVTLSVVSGDLGEGTVNPASLTFTSGNWDQAQSVTVTGEDDTELDGDITYQVTLDPSGSADVDYAAVPPVAVAVTNLDNENQPPTADAGPDQTVSDNDGSGDEVVVLDGSHSEDADGTIVAYEWKEGTSELGTSAIISPTLSVGPHILTLTVTDNAGATGSETVVVTVSPALATMHVGDLDNSSTNQGGTWTAIVTISVHDSGEGPVDGATVHYSWSGGASGSADCTTAPDGTCTVQKSGIKKKNGVVTFTVDNVTGSLDYDENNHDPDGDSDGTMINVNKPLHAAEADVVEDLQGQPLTQSMVRPAVDAALAHWAAAGVATSRLDTLRESDVEIIDLDGSLLGMAYSNWIVLDRDGAGFGWSRDSTAAGPSAGVDLAWAVTHELGHLLGYEHSHKHNPQLDVMAATLSPVTGRFRGRTQLALPDALAFRSSLLGGHGDEQKESGINCTVDLVDVPSIPAAVGQPQRIWRAAEARLLNEITDEATQLLDDELLDVLADLGV